MAKVYGNRWELINSLDQGGQADIFLVRDLNNEYSEQLVLKRIRNPKRRERFISEIQACQKLDHPNIIKFIDHSALECEFTDEKMYIVFKFAAGGNLMKRVKIYSNSIDSTLLVAQNIANGLQYAHDNKVIHRDVKPENILFSDQDHDCLIADFGLCLLTDQDRHTPDSEIVGPRSFMAPELEDGGKLEVTPSADIYSFGKVIYYMISGGTILPRERLYDTKYNIFEGKGRRLQLLGLLLSKMICQKDRRIQSLSEILKELQIILEWDKDEVPGFSPLITSRLSSIVEKGKNKISTEEHNKQIREKHKQLFQQFLVSFENWIKPAVEKLSDSLKQKDIIDTQIVGIDKPKEFSARIGNSEYIQGSFGLGFKLEVLTSTFSKKHQLVFFICKDIKARFIIGDSVYREKDEDIKIYFIPFYSKLDKSNDWKGFLNKGQIRGRSGKRNIGHITKSFYGKENTISLESFVSKWPLNVHEYEEVVTQAIEVFLDYIDQGASSIGN